MIFIVVKFAVKPEYADQWSQLVHSFTESTRAEPGNLWFDWSRSVDDPHEYVLIEAFEDGEAPAQHVESAHFTTMQQEFPQYLTATPQIISQQIDGSGWNLMGEISVD